MSQPLTPATALLLVIPPLLWAANAVVGRLVSEMIPPITLNFFRWTLALAILFPFAWSGRAQLNALWTNWRPLALLGLLGIGMYNALQYLALQTSTPLNVTLVGSSMPVWMLLIGRTFFGSVVTIRQAIGAFLSIIGVLIVLCRGEWSTLLALRMVAGDVYMIIATIAWSFYSWLLGRSTLSRDLRAHWAAFLFAQVTYGTLWAGLFTAGEWSMGTPVIEWSETLIASLLFVAIGPAVVAYRCWGLGVQRVGPDIAVFFINLTPLFAALLSLAFLGEMPRPYHAVAFTLIVGGILFSSKR